MLPINKPTTKRSSSDHFVVVEVLDELMLENGNEEHPDVEIFHHEESQDSEYEESEEEVDIEGIDSVSWLRTNFDVALPTLESSYTTLAIQDHSDLGVYFNEYIDNDLINLIVNKSNENKHLNLTIEECKVFIGITLLMSCINFPNLRMYWNRKYAVPIIMEAMTRNRFIKLKNSIKLVSNTDLTFEMKQKDKLWQVRPIINRVQQGCRTQKKNQEVAIDEITIPFNGENALTPHNLSVALKMFILANPDGLVCDMLVYQGKDTLPASEFSFKESVVLKLTETLVPGHIIYCDRQFMSLKLLEELNMRGYKCTGTVMNRHIPGYVKSDLENDKILSEKGRGSYDILVREDGKVAITKWYANKSIMFLSSIHAKGTPDHCKRYNKTKQVVIQRPEVAKQYDCTMKGIRLIDKLLSVCPSRTRNTWTLTFILHMLNLAIVNSWLKYKDDCNALQKPDSKILSLIDFKKEIAEKIILDNAYGNIENLDGNEFEEEENILRRGRRLLPRPSAAKRLHGANHLPFIGRKQNRCKNIGCRQKTRTLCKYCNIALCLTAKRNCFLEFHRP